MDCQVEKLEHFRHILLFEFSRGTKAGEAARNICTVYGVNTTGESTLENGFLISERIVLTLVTLHVRKIFGVWWRQFKQINLTMIHVIVLENWQIWWTVTIPPSCDIYIKWARVCVGTACSKPKPWNQGWPYVHFCLHSKIGSWTTTTIPIVYRYLCREMLSSC